MWRLAAAAGILVLGVIVLVAGLQWWDCRTDRAVRDWMNGPRTDPVVSIVLTAPTPNGTTMEARVEDPASLAHVSRLLPTASRGCQEPSGRYVRVTLRFASGRSIETDGGVSARALTLMPPSGDWWGGWEFVTVGIGPNSPEPIATAFPFAVSGSGARRF